MTTVIGILVGAMLGSRCRVLCLVPATLVAGAAIAALGQTHGVPPVSAVLSALAFAAGLQIGYVVGAIVRLLLEDPFAGVTAPGELRNRPARIS